MGKKYAVQLSEDQRIELERRYDQPISLRQRNRVQILLRSDAGEIDDDIAVDLGIANKTVANVRKRFTTEGLEASLTEKPRSGGPAKLDGKGEAVVIALACSPAPEGQAVWTAELLANRVVQMGIVESVSGATILRVLKKVRSSRGRRRVGVFPRV